MTKPVDKMTPMARERVRKWRTDRKEMEALRMGRHQFVCATNSTKLAPVL
jgi:hypothetical protein